MDAPQAYLNTISPDCLIPVEPQFRNLTKISHGGGCGCKVEPTQLHRLLASLPKRSPFPNLLVGADKCDDAAIYRISDDQVLVFTNDFQTPLVDDPYVYGYSAAANALSDVYAMGGDPLMATAIAGFPVDTVEDEHLSGIIQGGVAACHHAGVSLAGGHTINNPQPIFGLSVVGVMHPGRVKTNAAAQVGDHLILTKPLGLGVLASAYRAEMLDDSGYEQLVSSIMQINHSGRWLGKIEDVHALTDITGFGLAGHLVEMAQGARVTLRIQSDSVPIIELAEQLAPEGLFPGGAYRNMESYTDQLSFNENWDLDRQLLFTDPQTNGGLLIAASPGVTETVLARLHEDGFPAATVIGEVKERYNGNREVEFI